MCGGRRAAQLYTPYDTNGNAQTPVYTAYFSGGTYEVNGTTDGTTFTQTSVKKYYLMASVTVAVDSCTGSDCSLATGTWTLDYMLTDHLGSVVAVTDASGTLISQQRYLPFGQVRTDTNPPFITQTDMGYTSQRNNSYINLVDFRFRWMDPLLGRFVSPDDIIPDLSNPQTLNRYSYALGNPVKNTDPTGHMIVADGSGGNPNGGCGIPGKPLCNGGDGPSRPGNSGSGNGQSNNPNLLGSCIQDIASCYMQGWTNAGSAWSAITNPNTSGIAKVYSGVYLFGWVGFNGAAVVGLTAATYGAVVPACAEDPACADSAGNAAGDATQTLTRVFYSGGEAARNAANEWANANGGETIDMTYPGAIVNQTIQDLGYKVARPLIEAASEDYANGASGTVHVFLNPALLDYEHGVWATIEYPALLVNDTVTSIVAHIVGP